MVDRLFRPLAVGDTVAIMHKRYPTTTPTLQVGTVVKLSSSRATVEVPGMRQTVHTFKTVVKL